MTRAAGRILLLSLVLTALAGPWANSFAAEPSEQQAIESAREGLRGGSFPWYDAKNDSTQPIRLYEPPNWKPWDLRGVLRPLLWTGVVLAAVLVLWVIFKIARQYAGGDAPEAKAKRKVMLAAEHVEALPFLAQRSRDDLLGQARRNYEQGNYDEAIIYLFSYELVQLDKHALIQLAKGKTNRQYLREAGRTSGLRPLVEQTMVAFEHVFFGRRSLSRADFEACWHELPRFEQLVQAAK